MMPSEQDEDCALLESIQIGKALKQQNVELKSAFDILKKEYISREQDLVHLKKEYQNEIDSKKSLEFDCQNLYKKWNDELKIQAREFEKIQSEMISNTELELLKVKIIEDLETSYNEKVNWMKQEMEKYHNLYTKTLRELEILKINHQHTQHSFENILNEHKTTLNFKVLGLQQENEELKKQQCLYNMKDNNILLTLKQELQEYKTQNIEYDQQIKCLRTQINSLNGRNSKLLLENEEIKCQNIAKIKEFEGKLLIKNTECNGLKQIYSDLQKEHEIGKQNYLSNHNKLQKLENNDSYLKNSIKNKKEEINNLNESFCKKEKEIKQQHHKEIDILNDKISNLENEINSISSKKENLRIEINKLNNKNLIEIQQLKHQNFCDFNDLIESKHEMEKKYEETKRKLIKLQNQNNNEMDLLTKEIQTKTLKMEQIENEKINLSETNKTFEAEIENLLNDISCLKKENIEINGEYQSLTNKYRNILDINYKLTSKENKYLTQIEYLDNDINEINKKIDQKIQDLTLKYENKIEEINENNKNNIKISNKLKKEKAKYKKLATMAKLKVNELSKELINIKRNFERDLKSKTFEVTNLNKQIYQIERERDDIKFRLTMDSNSTATHNHNINNNDTDLITNNVDILLKKLEIEQKHINKNNKVIGDDHQSNLKNIDS